MKYLSILFIGLMMFTSCGNSEQTPATEVSTETTSEDAKPELSKEELDANSKTLIAKILDVSELNLQKNGAEKWMINEDAFTKLMKIKQQIYVISGNMESYEVSSYNEMGKEFMDFVKTIPVAENETANMELQKVINATNQQCLHLIESNLQNAQISIINLSLIYDEVPSYFTVKM